MSVYNAERYVREAVESILAQTFTDLEFIIFDDGSTDRSPQILREFAARDPRIRLTVRPNKGLTKSLNEALALARGEFIARMDCDDVALPHRLATQVEFLRGRDDVVCVGGYWQLIDGAGRLLITIRPPTDDAEMQQLLLKGHSPLCHPLATFRREAVMKLGGYDETFTTAQDVDLWLRLGEVGKLANVPEVLLKFRLHESSVSETRRLEQRRLSKLACERAWQRRGIAGTFEADEPWRPGRDRRSRHRYAMLYGWWAFNSGERRTAAVYALKAIRSLPLDRRGWVLLASAALKGKAAPPQIDSATAPAASQPPHRQEQL
jgi:glycosyltransferase involved in cell wall biosynthesis